MSKTINHDLRVVDGKTLYMPPWVEDQSQWGNLTLPDLSVVDTVQKYPIGTKYVEGDRVYRYAKAGGDIDRTDLGVKNGLTQGMAQRAVAVAAIGAKSATVTCASPDGASGDGNIVKDEFAGGYILFFTAGSVAPYDKQVRLITGNTAGTTSIVFTFDRGLEIALVATTSKAEAIASPYKHVVLSSAVHMPIVGVPTVLASSGNYLWVQTWGPCWLSLQSDVGVAGNYGMVWRHDGSLDKNYDTVDGYITNQYAGFALAQTSSAGQGAPFFMLQICP